VSSFNALSGTGVPSREIWRTWDSLNPGPPYRSGGPFYTLRIGLRQEKKSIGSLSTKGANIPGFPVGDYLRYDGVFANPIFSGDNLTSAAYANAGFSAPFDRTNLPPDAVAYGSEAFQRMRPQIAKAGLGQALAELRDLPSMLKGTSRFFHEMWRDLGGTGRFSQMRPKALADNFLNTQFGWVPFLADIRKFDDVLRNSQKYIDQVSKDNGLWVKRTRTIKTEETDTRVSLNTNSAGQEPSLSDMCTPLTVNGQFCSGQYHEVRRRDRTTVWAVGRFKYYRAEFDRDLPWFDSAWARAQRQILIHGASVNPSLIYKITPWTWLIDWFTGIGGMVDAANAMALDGVVCKYLYIMQHTVREVYQLSHLNLYTGARIVEWRRFLDSKQRVSAEGPYGFALPSSLSSKQLAILAALGLSRSFH